MKIISFLLYACVVHGSLDSQKDYELDQKHQLILESRERFFEWYEIHEKKNSNGHLCSKLNYSCAIGIDLAEEAIRLRQKHRMEEIERLKKAREKMFDENERRVLAYGVQIPQIKEKLNFEWKTTRANTSLYPNAASNWDHMLGLKAESIQAHNLIAHRMSETKKIIFEEKNHALSIFAPQEPPRQLFEDQSKKEIRVHEIRMVATKAKQQKIYKFTQYPLNQNIQLVKQRICPQKHKLVKFKTTDCEFYCDFCKKHEIEGKFMYGCRPCNFDLCLECLNEPKNKENIAKQQIDEEMKQPKIEHSEKLNGAMIAHGTIQSEMQRLDEILADVPTMTANEFRKKLETFGFFNTKNLNKTKLKDKMLKVLQQERECLKRKFEIRNKKGDIMKGNCTSKKTEEGFVLTTAMMNGKVYYFTFVQDVIISGFTFEEKEFKISHYRGYSILYRNFKGMEIEFVYKNWDGWERKSCGHVYTYCECVSVRSSIIYHCGLPDSVFYRVPISEDEEQIVRIPGEKLMNKTMSTQKEREIKYWLDKIVDKII